MRIAHILTRLLRAGSEENTILCCLGQVEAGHEVYLIHGDDFEADYYSRIGSQIKLVHVPSLTHPISPIQDVIAYRQLTAELNEIKPDIVHTHQSKAGIIGRLAARASSVPIVVHGVHIISFSSVSAGKRLIYLMAERIAAKFTDAFIDVSEGVRNACMSVGIGQKAHHHVIYSGFDLERFRSATAPADWRDLLAVSEDDAKPPVVLMLAALEERKRHLEFLEFVPLIVAAFPKARIIFCGEGPCRKEIVDRISFLGLKNNVVLTGFRQDPEKLIALADICILTSTREGLPRVLMQYLAGGKPCVVCDLPGIGEIMQDGVNARILPSDQIGGVADEVVKLIGDSAGRDRYSAAAMRTDLSRWDSKVMIRDVQEIYDRYLGVTTSRAAG